MLKTLSARDPFVEQTQYLPEPILKLVTPVLIATLSAALAYLGWTQISRGIVGRSFLARQKRNYGVETSDYFPELDSRDGRHTSRVEMKSTFVQIFQLLLSFGAAFVIAMLLTTSLEISLAVSLLVTAIPFFVAKRGVEKSIERGNWHGRLQSIHSFHPFKLASQLLRQYKILLAMAQKN